MSLLVHPAFEEVRSLCAAYNRVHDEVNYAQDVLRELCTGQILSAVFYHFVGIKVKMLQI